MFISLVEVNENELSPTSASAEISLNGAPVFLLRSEEGDGAVIKRSIRTNYTRI
jgi:hypothetical protein